MFFYLSVEMETEKTEGKRSLPNFPAFSAKISLGSKQRTEKYSHADVYHKQKGKSFLNTPLEGQGISTELIFFFFFQIYSEKEMDILMHF